MSGKYALIVANTEYADPGLAQLSAPGKDAEDFARVLKDQHICAFDDVKVLLNQPEHIVRRAIEVYFDQRKPSDLVLFYFSGHGIRDEVGALYLAVKNTVRSRLRSTAIKSDYIREIMDQSRSKRQVLILDCCNSGAFARGTKAATGGSMGTASAFEGTGYGHIVLTASDSTQFAWEGDKVIGETQNSLFTHFLVKGLEGEADQDGDGTITIDELYDYAYEQIVTRTPKQTPGKWSYKQQGEIVLRQSPRIEEIKPARLPADLLAATESTLPYIREGAVRQLSDLLKSRNPAMAQAARVTLEKMALEDDSRYVASAAGKALDSVGYTREFAFNKNVGAPESILKSTSGQPSDRQIEDAHVTQKKAVVSSTVTPSELQKKRSQSVALPATAKPKSSTAIWTIVFLAGMGVLIYATWTFVKMGSSLAPQPTEPPRVTEPLIEPTFAPADTAVPTDPPTAAPVVYTVVVTAPPTSAASFPTHPVDFIHFYFENINKRNYDLTWNLLSEQFKAKLIPDGKDSYIEIWNKVSNVTIYSTDYTQISDVSAIVIVKANIQANPLNYFLVWDSLQNTWIFDLLPASFNVSCSNAPKTLSVGKNALIVTASEPLLLRESPTDGNLIEKLSPATQVYVVDGPICKYYRPQTVFFWWWKVRSPSGSTGWIVEGSDSRDPVFIRRLP